MNKITAILAALLCAALLHAHEDKYIKDAILKYNYGIIKMCRSGETQFFKTFSSKEVAIKAKVWFESWKFSNLTMLAEINDLRFFPIGYGDNNATISTVENWTYSYVNLATRKIELKPITMFYRMNYSLQKIDGIWKIVDVKVLKEEEFNKAEKHELKLDSSEKNPAEDPTS